MLARATAHADVLVDVRLVQDGTRRFYGRLVQRGFDLEGINAMGIGHRFTDGHVKIDLLAPDVRVRNKKALTTIPPARTVCVPGGNQALARSRGVGVARGKRIGQGCQRIRCVPHPGGPLAKTSRGWPASLDVHMADQLSIDTTNREYWITLFPRPLSCESIPQLPGKRDAFDPERNVRAHGSSPPGATGSRRR
jgi:hypothetical protein